MVMVGNKPVIMFCMGMYSRHNEG